MHTVRFRFGLLLHAFAAVTAAAGDALLKYIPAGTEYAVSVDADALRKLSFFKDLSTNSDAKTFLEDFERDYNIRLEDCSELLFVGGGRRLRGMLAETRLSEQALASRLRKFGDRFSISGEGGRKLYCLLSADSIVSSRITIALTYLEPQVVLATEREYIAPFFAGLAAPAEARRALVTAPKGRPLAWSFLRVEALTGGKKKKNDLSSMFLKGMRTAYLELNVAGDGSGWRLDGSALCANAASAQQIAMLLPTYLQLGAGLLFADDPALGREFLQQVKIIPDNDRVILELNVPKSLADRLGGFLESQAKKRIAPPDPVPPGVGPAVGPGGK